MDLFLALLTLAAVGYFLVWEDFLKPMLKGSNSVRNSAPRPAVKLRSRRSPRSNVVNEGSAHHSAAGEGSNVQNVQPAPAPLQLPISPGAPAGEVLTLSPRELQQLAESVAARSSGATVEEAIYRGFGVKKGGSAGYRRAKELFDTATAPPR